MVSYFRSNQPFLYDLTTIFEIDYTFYILDCPFLSVDVVGFSEPQLQPCVIKSRPVSLKLPRRRHPFSHI